jgi:hypothetical protein
MPRLSLLLLTLLGFAAFCNGQTVSDPQFEGSLAVPTYENGYVFDWDAPQYTNFILYAPDTKPVYSLALKGANNAFYETWAIDTDGAAARVYHNSEHRGKIDLLDLSGKVTRTIDTGSYIPTRVTFAPDHSLWIIGFVGEYESPAEDFNVVRHYARTGEELGQALPWSHIAGDLNAETALQCILGGRWLFSGSDRIGFLSLVDSGGAKWIEVGFDGKLLGQYDLGSYGVLSFQPRAMASSGNVYARVYRDGRANGYAVLDKSSNTWGKVTGYPKGALIGSDGDNLVFSQLVGGWTVLHQVASAALAVQEAELTASAHASESN